MAITTTVNLSQLEFEKRFDGELYNPHLLISLDKLKDTGYNLLPLGSICSIKSGTTPRDRDDSLMEGPVLFKTTDVRNNVMSAYDSFYHISHKIHNRMLVTKIQPYDILLNIVGATLDVIGRSSFILDDFQEANITQAMVFLRVRKKILPGYLFAFLNTRYAQDQIKRYARPTGQYNLNLIEVGKILIPQIQHDKQQEIEQLIYKSAKLQQESRRQFKLAEHMLNEKLLLKDFHPKDQKIYITNYTDVVNSCRMDSNHFREDFLILTSFLCDNFQCKTIGQLSKINRRGLQPVYDRNGTVMVINSKHLSKTHIMYEQTERTSMEYYVNQKSANLQNGDVLVYSTGAYVGLTNVFNSNVTAIASNHVNILRIKEEYGIDPNYLSLVMNSDIGKLQVQKYARGSAQLELYPADLAKFLIPIIDKDVMHEIGELVRNSLISLNESKKLLAQAQRRIEEIIEQ